MISTSRWVRCPRVWAPAAAIWRVPKPDYLPSVQPAGLRVQRRHLAAARGRDAAKHPLAAQKPADHEGHETQHRYLRLGSAKSAIWISALPGIPPSSPCWSVRTRTRSIFPTRCAKTACSCLPRCTPPCRKTKRACGSASSASTSRSRSCRRWIRWCALRKRTGIKLPSPQ